MRLIGAFFVSTVILGLAACAEAETMRVEVEGKGRISILLYTKEAPKTTAHIMRLARSGFYDGQRFHLVIKSPKPYRVQIGDPASRGGDLDSVGQGGSGAKIPYEDSGKPNVEGAVGLSTVPGDKNSGDSQFYMLLGNARFLDGSYTVFGRVVEGMDILRNIAKGDRVGKVTITD
jgi:peptidyl-prolyl cis-trans isomerase B (cyclophilin B)